MSSIYDVIKRQIITEKTSLNEEEQNQVVFEVALRANKHQIREAIEGLFDVKVTRVRTSVMQGKRKRFGRQFGKRSNWKRAVVTLAKGSSIDIFGAEEELS